MNKAAASASFSWPDPIGFIPLKWHFQDGIPRGGSRFKSYFGAGQSIESRFLDILVHSHPNMKVHNEADFLDSGDRIDLAAMSIKIDRNTRQLFLNYASAFRRSCPDHKANQMLAASYVVMLGKLNYSYRRYPLSADKMKALKAFLVNRIVTLSEANSSGLPVCENMSLEELCGHCSKFLTEALDTLKYRARSEFGCGPTAGLHSLRRRFYAAERLNRLRKDFDKDQVAKVPSYARAHAFARFINHIPLLVQTVGITIDSCLRMLTEKDIRAASRNMEKLWHSGPNIETAMAQNLARNTFLLKGYVNSLKDLAHDTPEIIAKAYSKKELEEFDGDTIFLAHLLYLRFNVLRNDAKASIRCREKLLDSLESEIANSVFIPSIGYGISYEQAQKLKVLMNSEQLKSLADLSLPQLEAVKSICSEEQLEVIQNLDEKSLGTLLNAVIESRYGPLTTLLNSQQKERIYQALRYLKVRLGWELELIGKNILTQHLTVSDILRLVGTPKSFKIMADTYFPDEQLGDLSLKKEVKASAILQSIVMSVVAPVAAILGLTA